MSTQVLDPFRGQGVADPTRDFFDGGHDLFSEISETHKLDDGVELVSALGRVRFQFVGNCLRIRGTRRGTFNSSLSPLIVETPRVAPSIEFSETDERVQLVAGGLSIQIELRSGLFDVTHNGKLLVEQGEICWQDQRPTLRSQLQPNDSCYGTGLRSRPLNLRGRSFRIWTRNTPNPEFSRDSSYAVVPFVLVHKPGRAYGIFHDNPAFAEFDLAERSPNLLAYQAVAGELSCYIIPGPSPAEVMRDYTELSGRMELPPRWLLGFGHSRYGMENAEEVKRRVMRYRERRLPLSWLAIDLDYMRDNLPFTWNEERFGEPGKLPRWLRFRGVRPVLIMDPLVPILTDYAPYREMLDQRLFCNAPDGTLAVVEGFAGPAHVPDLANPKCQQYLAKLFAAVTRTWNVSGWWLDKQELAARAVQNQVNSDNAAEVQSASMGDTETLAGDAVVHHGNLSEWEFHNRFCVEHARTAFEGLLLADHDRRPFILARAQFCGMQRYAFGWTGDVNSDFGSLANSLAQLLNLGLSGLPAYGTDIGGFFSNSTPELLVRWVQAGVFNPLARIHSFRDTIENVPWHHGDTCREIILKYLQLRSRLAPLNNDLFWQAMEQGTPLMRPMFFDCWEDELPDEKWMPTQYFWGPLLVAPVVDSGHTGKMVYLPGHERTWYDFWTRKEYTGGQSYHVPAPEDTLPLFVPAGAILPMSLVLENADQPVTDLFINVYSGASGAYTMHHEDGETRGYRTGDFSAQQFEYSGDRSSGQFRIGKRSGVYVPPKRDIVVRLIVADEPKRVLCDGQPIHFHYQADNGGSIAVQLEDDGLDHLIEYADC